MTTPTVLLIVSYQGYQPYEYGITRKVLQQAGFKVVVGSNKHGTAHAKPTDLPNPYDHVVVDIQVSEAKPEDYHGIFLIGGPGALDCLDTSVVHKLVKDAYKHNRLVGAICISPRILAHAGILSGKSATGWNDDDKLENIFAEHNVTYIPQPVVVDHTIITADGPQAAQAFGTIIVEVVNSYWKK